jgi:UDP-glucuronate 4-epimerase
MKILVTGNAGFIGFHVVRCLLARGDSVVGFDSVNDYYDRSLKEARLSVLQDEARLHGSEYGFVRADLADEAAVKRCFKNNRFDRVIHLAAQAGVRHSLKDPMSYTRCNLVAFTNILEACRYAKLDHLTFASTSSVYGENAETPFTELSDADHPKQFYAATKRANELMAHSYANLYGLPVTGLRFFTVYGPWARPDMALYKFTRLILENRPIPVFNYGHHSRDFTYIDDVVGAIVKVNDKAAKPESATDLESWGKISSAAPYRIFNVGNGTPIKLLDFINALEAALGVRAKLELLPHQPGDALVTFADSSALRDYIDWRAETPVSRGVQRFVEWYLCFYEKVKNSRSRSARAFSHTVTAHSSSELIGSSVLIS